ncbi:hypothetical protein NDU88_005373 [Pleurodeles waltl]|uniref:Uncharacterized protein n=1 Tax=Pleurodeles waltl TaxID=8319 RepID=A0AAV7M9S8_PLEWA|nr:hypothetical protein NDU88_005373 [Pleurodeles waltl]
MTVAGLWPELAPLDLKLSERYEPIYPLVKVWRYELAPKRGHAEVQQGWQLGAGPGPPLGLAPGHEMGLGIDCDLPFFLSLAM